MMLIGATMLATILYTVDSTIVNVALPHMQGSLQATQDQIAWVVTSYIVMSAIATPLSGWLGARNVDQRHRLHRGFSGLRPGDEPR
jgi:DHA2 family multidrug resistance protein